MIIYPYKQFTPDIHPEAFIADNAVITGDVVIGEQSSIWFSAVIREMLRRQGSEKESAYKT